MKKLFLISGLIFFSHIYNQGGKVELTDQHIGFFMTKGGYRSVWVDYSYGRCYPYRPWIDSVWKKPKLVHCDIRPFLSDPNASVIDDGVCLLGDPNEPDCKSCHLDVPVVEKKTK